MRFSLHNICLYQHTLSKKCFILQLFYINFEKAYWFQKTGELPSLPELSWLEVYFIFKLLHYYESERTIQVPCLSLLYDFLSLCFISFSLTLISCDSILAASIP